MVLTPLLGEAATTSWPPWRRMARVFEPISPVPADDHDLHGLPSVVDELNAATLPQISMNRQR
jgi:hypothetical protein